MSNDVAADPRYLTNQGDSGSKFIVPVKIAGQVVGTLDIESARTDALTNADARAYQDLAEALAPLWAAG